jgi:hypothetical protein
MKKMKKEDRAHVQKLARAIHTDYTKALHVIFLL